MLVDPSKGLDMLIDAIDLSSALDKLIDVVNMSYIIDMLYGVVNTFKGRRPVEFCCQPVQYPMNRVSKRSMVSVNWSNTM
jgi:hypothetical protein